MLIGKLTTSTRERLMVTLVENGKGAKSIDCRIYNVLQEGELSPTPAGLTVSPEQVDAFVDLLREAGRKAKEKA
jgi:hypothetical protein